MRKGLIIILMALVPMALWAQSDSTGMGNGLTPTVDTITTTADTLAMKAMPGTAGADEYMEPVAYRTPNKNPIYYFGSPFASHFFETPIMIGGYHHDLDIGIGLNYTYLPEVWGWNIATYASINAGWYMAGADYRLSKPWNATDWQLYGDIGVRHFHFPYDREYAPVLAAGIRMSDISRFKFGLSSATMGIMTDFHYTYFTFGISLTMLFLSPILVVL